MVTFSLVEDGAGRCLGGIDRKGQLGTGLRKANVVAWERQDFKRSKASNCLLDISIGPFGAPARGLRDAATVA